MNIQNRLNLVLNGQIRQDFEKCLLPMDQWQSKLPEMPPECADVVTGEAFYAGCEGIGFNERLGWFLVVWEPTEEPTPVNEPVGGGLVMTSAQICAGPTKQDSGTLTLIYAQRSFRL